jgi:hypothetical protein
LAFCTACGNAMTDGSTFCTKCGAKMAPGAVSTGGGAAAAPGPQTKSGGSGLKIVLIIFGVLALIAVLAVGALIGGAYFLKHKVEQSVKTDAKGDVTSVNIGGLRIDASKDGAAIISKMGVDIYPGAVAVPNTASSATIGATTNMHAQFTSEASVDDIFNFYKEKYPQANVFESPDSKTIVQGSEDKELLTIIVKDEEGRTALHITKMTKGVR